MKTWQKVALGGAVVSGAAYLLWRVWPAKNGENGMKPAAVPGGVPYLPDNAGKPVAPDASQGYGGLPAVPTPGQGGLEYVPTTPTPMKPPIGGTAPSDIATPAGVPGLSSVLVDPTPLAEVEDIKLVSPNSGESPMAVVRLPMRRPYTRKEMQAQVGCPPGFTWNPAIGGCTME